MADRILKVPVESAQKQANITDSKQKKLTLYLYAMPKLNSAKYFMGEAVQSFVNISTAELDRTTIEAYGDEAITTMVSNFEGSSAVGTKAKSLVTYATLTSTQWVKHNLEKINIGQQGTIEPLMATVNAPYNEADYRSGKQQVFIVSNVDIIKEASDNQRLIDKNGEYNIELTNIEAFKTSAKFSQINFYFGDYGNVLNDIKLRLSNTSPFQRINGKGIVNGKETDLSFTTDAVLMPFKASPISTDQNLTIFADWFDYDLAMPLFIAKLFVTPQPLSALKNVKVGNQSVIDDIDIQCIIDMLAMSVGFANSWADIARYTGSEANEAGKGNAGRLLSYATIGIAGAGRPNVRISSLEGTDPIKAVDGVYESYLRNNVNKEGSLAAKTVKQIVAALSRFIYSSYTIGKGQNGFNKIYLPWTLKPLDALNLSNGTHQGDGITQEKQYILKADTKFQLESSYFKVNTNSLDVLEATTNLSDVKVIQSDRKITLPTIPLQVQPIDKLPLAGDVDTTSDKDLKYKMFIPLSGKANMAKFMSDTATSVSSATNKITKIFQNYTTPVNPNPLQSYSSKTPAEITAIVKADVMSKYAQLGINENNITFDPATATFPRQLIQYHVGYHYNTYYLDVDINPITNHFTYQDFIFTNTGTGLSFTVDGGDIGVTITDLTSLVISTFPDPSIVDTRTFKVTVSAETRPGTQTHFTKELTLTFSENGVTNPDGKLLYVETIQIPSLSIANFPDITYNIERETVYNKAKFYNSIAQTFGVQTVDIPLKEVQNLPIQRIHSLTLSGFWGDEVGVSLNQNINMVANNSSEFDETISQFTMIFC